MTDSFDSEQAMRAFWVQVRRGTHLYNVNKVLNELKTIQADGQQLNQMYREPVCDDRELQAIQNAIDTILKAYGSTLSS